MVRIILIRPGTTEFDQDGRIQGTLDVPLCAKADSQIDHITEALRDSGISMVYGTSCQAATETAQRLAAALGSKYKTLDKLQNVDHGLWQGLLVDEVKRKQPKVYRQWQEHPETVCPPEGEMFEEARQRVERALTKIVRKNKDGTVALVAPEPLASLIHACCMGEEVAATRGEGHECGSWEVLDVEPAVVFNGQGS